MNLFKRLFQHHTTFISPEPVTTTRAKINKHRFNGKCNELKPVFTLNNDGSIFEVTTGGYTRSALQWEERSSVEYPEYR
ncbi:MAG: hypothetical protein WAZ18_06715 [Alphaproteobacteria bacterium]